MTDHNARRAQTPDLLSRLAAATAGSAELDRGILEALGWTFKWRWHRPNGLQLPHGERAPRPTRSLDDIDAMIHEAGMEWWKMMGHRGDNGCWIEPPWVWVGRTGAMKAVMLPDPRRLCLALSEGFLRAREAGR